MTLTYSQIRLPKAILSFLAILASFTLIAKFNRYIFPETNVTYLLLLLMLSAIALHIKRLPRKLLVSRISLLFVCFIVYMLLRLTDDSIYLVASVFEQRQSSGLRDIFFQIIYFGLFFIGAFFYFNKKRIPVTIWIMILGYIIAFIARNSIYFQSLKDGYNLSIGYVIFSLIPFAFLNEIKPRSTGKIIPHLLLTGCILWLAIVGVRTATFSLIIFQGCLLLWPVLTKNKCIFTLFFWGSLFIVLLMFFFYIILMKAGALEYLNQLSLDLFHKRLGTRSMLWYEVWTLIQQQPLFGYGLQVSSSALVAPVFWIDENIFYRDNLAAHSAYFEILLRLGFIGLTIFIFIFYSSWKSFWLGRKKNEVKVAASFLIASLFFMSTQGYWIFNMELRSGLGWLILGIGVGSSFAGNINFCMQERRLNKAAII